jgi:CRISPR type III-A-associated RAMP protein Csm5
MNDFLLRFTLDISVLTPTHIGSGNKLSSKSFILSGGEVAVIDEDKLITWISHDRRRVDRFMMFAEDPTRRIDAFFDEHHLPLDNFVAYRIKNQAPTAPRNVLEFIKQPDDRPYLPGSSFRGALKSALLRGYVVSGAVSRRPERRTQVIQAVGPVVAQGGKNPGREAEASGFVPADHDIDRGKRPNYDLIRAMSFADSQAIDSSKLQVNEVQVLSAQTSGTLQPKTMPHGGSVMRIYAELLRPGTKLQMPLTINDALLSSEGPARELRFGTRRTLVEHFRGYCRLAADDLLRQESEFYGEHRRSDLAELCSGLRKQQAAFGQDCFLLPIGWGTGFDAKTITDQLGEEIFGQVVAKYESTQRLGKPGGTGRWLGSAASPKSRKVAYYADDRLEPLGWLKVRVVGG